MKFLLDTHLVLWTVSESRRISEQGRDIIGSPESEIVFSVVNLWEVAIKRSLKRPDFQVDPRVLRRAMLDNGYEELLVTGEHAVAVDSLPLIHRDPFDRLLVAQSIVEGITLLTTDPRVAQYPAPVQRV